MLASRTQIGLIAGSLFLLGVGLTLYKAIVLGLISTKTPALESKDILKKRVDEAAGFVDLDRLAISPQCGFASVETGNPVSLRDQEAKLRLVVEVAQEIWGEA